MLTVAEARGCIDRGVGFQVDDQGCWISDHRASTGYGPFLNYWIAVNGREPHHDLELHHRCYRGRRGCVNPSHVEEVTPEQHVKLHRGTSPDQKQEWGDAIRAERQARCWSQAQMGRELGVHPQTVKGWEIHKNGPSKVLRRIVAHKLGWAAEPRKWVVTVAVQDVVVAHSAGEAAQAVLSSIPGPVRGVRKRELIETRAVK